ncbi:MFS transporter [Gluconacetobacter tumulisoli]|uniref:MFS transporter n=1 Tax=Gluconacetobacter tumulisoli TaxID=1286189 RepID=A0A7W4K5J2_9PROT|nr:MFS transporter [Gluconacetobacter tumulisoli]MBB2200658.1 MFS transporter [Gluconacetobacter tumulisoli]
MQGTADVPYASVPPPGGRTAVPWLAVIATTLGGVLEWYDLILYGLFAVTISQLFFPTAHDPGLSLMLGLGSFGVAFVARPIGAACLGSYADRHGRRRGLVLSSILMTVGTGLLAVVPTYAAIGPFAPLVIICSRLLQGFAAGGEFGSAATMLAERNPAYRGVLASLQWSAGGVAVTLASCIAWLLHHVFTDAQVLAWAWRLPFLFGVALGPLTTWLRLRSDESPEFSRREGHLPLREILQREPVRLLVAIGLVSAGATGSYLNIYMPTLARAQLHLDQSAAFVGTMVSGLLTIVLPPLFAMRGDRTDRRRMMGGMALLGGLMVWPLFRVLVGAPSVLTLVMVQGVLVTTIYCGYYASVPALFTEIFRPRNRTTAIAVSYALGQLLFGGFTPMLLSGLVNHFHDNSLPGLYLLVTVVISLGCLKLSARYAPTGKD